MGSRNVLISLFCVLALVACLVSGQDFNHDPATNSWWRFGCDWKGKDITNVRVPGEQCATVCLQNARCTHFTWTRFEGGTCWLKTDMALVSDFVLNNDNSIVCGRLFGRGE